jgi:hypothetical protein
MLEILSLLSLSLLLLIILKVNFEISLLFLFLCLIVGEARIGLRLIIFSSRNQSIELLSLNIL